MSVVLPYSELHTQLTPEQNKVALEKVAAIINQHQSRSVGMKLVIKCDHCSHFEDVQKGHEMMLHEQKCSFNPANKKCYSCNHRDYEWDVANCKVGCNVTDGEKAGNCAKWEEEV